MSESKTSHRHEAQPRPGVHGMPAQGADPNTVPSGPAARMRPAHPELTSDRTEASASAPRLEVHIASEADGSDEAIAERTLKSLFSAAPLRRERIAMRIARGQVTLSGTVGTDEERVAVERLVAGIDGVAKVINLVAVTRHGRTTGVARGVADAYGGDAESGDIAGRVEAVFLREAGLGATEVMISALGGKVVLSGQVRSWRERDLAERIAWATPGVTEVLDRIMVG
jgi:osmotically-inducible protein OsmY